MASPPQRLAAGSTTQQRLGNLEHQTEPDVKKAHPSTQPQHLATSYVREPPQRLAAGGISGTCIQLNEGVELDRAIIYPDTVMITIYLHVGHISLNKRLSDLFPYTILSVIVGRVNQTDLVNA